MISGIPKESCEAERYLEIVHNDSSAWHIFPFCYTKSWYLCILACSSFKMLVFQDPFMAAFVYKTDVRAQGDCFSRLPFLILASLAHSRLLMVLKNHTTSLCTPVHTYCIIIKVLWGILLFKNGGLLWFLMTSVDLQQRPSLCWIKCSLLAWRLRFLVRNCRKLHVLPANFQKYSYSLC